VKPGHSLVVSTAAVIAAVLAISKLRGRQRVDRSGGRGVVAAPAGRHQHVVLGAAMIGFGNAQFVDLVFLPLEGLFLQHGVLRGGAIGLPVVLFQVMLQSPDAVPLAVRARDPLEVDLTKEAPQLVLDGGDLVVLPPQDLALKIAQREGGSDLSDAHVGSEPDRSLPLELEDML